MRNALAYGQDNVETFMFVRWFFSGGDEETPSDVRADGVKPIAVCSFAINITQWFMILR